MVQLTASYKITGIKKKTQAANFKECKVGDVIQLSYGLHGSYHGAPQVKVCIGDNCFWNYADQLSKTLDKFELEKIQYVPVSVLFSYQDAAEKLAKLEAYGVDNWSGYSDALSDPDGLFEEEE